jgi:hypothetical protein
MIWPSTRQLGMTSFILLKQRKNVDLPQPDGPIKEVTEFASMFNETS